MDHKNPPSKTTALPGNGQVSHKLSEHNVHTSRNHLSLGEINNLSTELATKEAKALMNK